MSKFDLRIETVLDGLLKLANDYDVELQVETCFDEPHLEDLSCIVRNAITNDFGIMSVNVKEYPNEEIVFFLFDSDTKELRLPSCGSKPSQCGVAARGLCCVLMGCVGRLGCAASFVA